MRYVVAFFALVLFLSIFTVWPRTAAFEASSTSFEIHGSAIESVSGRATSSTYNNQSAGGQTATGISTVNNRNIYSGILYWLFSFFTPRYEQIHFRWRNDDGSESGANWAAAEDTTLINVQKSVIKRLRFEISNEGWTRGGSQQFTIEFAEPQSGGNCSTGPFVTNYTAVPVNESLRWRIATSSNVTDGEATTNVTPGLTDENNTFKAGEVKDTGNTTNPINLTSQDFTEIEYTLAPNASSTDGATYCFRLTNNGSMTNYVYTRYAEATLSSGLPPTGELTSTVFDTTGSVDGPAYNSIMWKGSFNSGTGRVRFQLATSDNTSGPWTYVGGSTCTGSDWYDTSSPDAPVELSCAPAYHNNQRYFRYKIQLCSASNCTSQGQITPTINEVVVSWSP